MSLDGSKAGRGAKPVSADEVLRPDNMASESEAAADFLKALSHEGRLMILFHLAEGERSVTELEKRLGSRQAAVSQQLARLRLDGLVTSRRDGKGIIYSISDARVNRMITLVYELFSRDGQDGPESPLTRAR